MSSKDKTETKSDVPPKKPKTAYLIFAATKRPQIMENNKGIKVGEISKIIGSMWKELTEDQKKVFVDQAEKEKADYEKNLEEYQKNHPETNDSSGDERHSRKTRKHKHRKLPPPPKKPKNAYLLYSDAIRPKIMEENKGIKVGELSKLISKTWKELKEEEKEVYTKKADELKAQFEKEIKEYNKKRDQIDSSLSSDSD
ncbi:high mobility group protein dsp1 [Anaeramoeba ignava]|uniref:High mobility group protein dsp1 n=1 Tax=Anaeramoeba ignava TaxID=1746090 RepID=A0A9Q0L741_ANAIG|nr:high mobility group protein dsp1 [Anaeramoeba ignava]